MFSEAWTTSVYTWLPKTLHKTSAHTPAPKELIGVPTKDLVEAINSDLVLMLLEISHDRPLAQFQHTLTSTTCTHFTKERQAHYAID